MLGIAKLPEGIIGINQGSSLAPSTCAAASVSLSRAYAFFRPGFSFRAISIIRSRSELLNCRHHWSSGQPLPGSAASCAFACGTTLVMDGDLGILRALLPRSSRRRRVQQIAIFEVRTDHGWSINCSARISRNSSVVGCGTMCGMSEPHKRGQSEKNETSQQKCVIQCQEGRFLDDENSKVARHHVRAEPGVFQPSGELLKQIEGSKPPSPKKIGQKRQRLRRTPDSRRTDLTASGLWETRGPRR